jgi:ABC-type Fe3+/spermidine/putrescine transport system ATPase subunit
MNRGRVEQIGHPLEIYHHPQTLFVADFIGQNNFIPAKVKALAPKETSMTIVLDNGWEVKTIYQEGYAVGADVVACVRPETILVWPQRPLEGTWDNLFETEVVVAAFLGSEYRYEVARTGKERIKVTSPRGGMNSGDRVWIGWAQEAVRLLPPASST